MKNKYFNIVVDTREQKPWDFNDSFNITKAKLDTGDYSIEGLEHLVCIERKSSVNEVSNNITEKRFKDVLDRMAGFPHPHILFEFDLHDILNFPHNSGIPQRLWKNLRISPLFLLKYITEINTIYGIHTHFCGNRENAQAIAISIMKRVNEKHNRT
jgi:ERCC4-type nuclease